MTPNPVSMAIGVAQQFTAVGRDVGGNFGGGGSFNTGTSQSTAMGAAGAVGYGPLSPGANGWVTIVW